MRSSLASTLTEQIKPPALPPLPTISPLLTRSRREFGCLCQKRIGEINVFLRVDHSAAEKRVHGRPVSILRATTVQVLPEADYLFRRLHGMSNGQNQIEVGCRPFRAIDLTVGKATHLCSVLFEILALLWRFLQLSFDKSCFVCLGSDRVSSDQSIEEDLGPQSVVAVGSSKYRIGLLSKDESTLDRGAEDGGENRKHRTHSRPSIPPDYAVAHTWLHARADSVPQLLQSAHSLIPLWTRRHSAMPSRWAENCHG